MERYPKAQGQMHEEIVGQIRDRLGRREMLLVTMGRDEFTDTLTNIRCTLSGASLRKGGRRYAYRPYPYRIDRIEFPYRA